jgi:hypothetical protein
VVVDCSYNQWTITSIAGLTLESAYSGGTIRLADGGIVSKTGTPTLGAGTGSGYTREAEVVVMPNASGTVTVNIPVSAISRQGLAAIPATSVYTATFSTGFVEGCSYRLYMHLRLPKFAGSNIYWDGNASSGTMKFDKYGTTTHQGYQGLFFRWGSLVGVSPQGTLEYAMAAGIAIYVPNGTGWKPSTYGGEGYNAWWASPSDLTSGQKEISYFDRTYGIVDLTAAAQNTSARWTSWRGDICQYIGSKDGTLSGYRMPIKGEFGPSGNSMNLNGWTFTGAVDLRNLGNNYGTYDFVSNNKLRATNSSINGGLVLPASGYRIQKYGALQEVSRYAYYAMASSSNVDAKDTFIGEKVTSVPTVWPQNSSERSAAFPIRCVIND